MPILSFERTLEELEAKRRAIIYRAAGLLAASVRRSQDPSLTILEINEIQLQVMLFEQADLQKEIANRDWVRDQRTHLSNPFFVIDP